MFFIYIYEPWILSTLQKSEWSCVPLLGKLKDQKWKKETFLFLYIYTKHKDKSWNEFILCICNPLFELLFRFFCFCDSLSKCLFHFFSSYLIRPSSLSPQPSPLIDERKFHSNQTMTKREEPTGADNPDTESKGQRDCSNTHPETQKFGKAKSLSALEEKPDISCDMRKSRTFSPADLRVVLINF